ncbi:hypothetical protein MMC11_002255 [Xylographa trunciseda]|nr:hypothetical protein [Xylographa trunciseda]
MTGQPQAVIVRVDVGTQALGAAMHNANTGRVPVLIFAGLCPYTENGELPGSRTEYQHWLQDAPDQRAIVRQYCRYVGELRSARTTKDTVARAFQFATSDPKGPVYLVGAREVMAETTTESYALESQRISPIQPSALPQEAVETIAKALVQAKSPLIITGYSGRNHACPSQLVKLAETIPGLRVHDTGGCDMCFPFSHRSSLGFRLSFDQVTTEADVILVLDCDVPWIPTRNRPRDDARIYHVDIDPLNATIGAFFFPADGRWRADSYTALLQLNAHLATSANLKEALHNPIYVQRWKELQEQHSKRLASFDKLNSLPSHESLNIHHVGAAIKSAVPPETNYVVEAATCSMNVADQLRVDIPGSWLNSGGAGLGWSGGAALGVKLALDGISRPNFICQIVGDGTYLFSVPSSVHWVAARYGIPVLTIILNNRGWTAPRRSLELCQPSEQALKATNREMHISLDPAPDYCGIAKAAAGSSFGGLTSGLFTGRASTAGELADVLKEAVRCVKKGRGAVVEAVLNIGEMGEEKGVDC